VPRTTRNANRRAAAHGRWAAATDKIEASALLHSSVILKALTATPIPGAEFVPALRLGVGRLDVAVSGGLDFARKVRIGKGFIRRIDRARRHCSIHASIRCEAGDKADVIVATTVEAQQQWREQRELEPHRQRMSLM
jgi:hypothetical protein